jgi:hypothetical protein
MSQVFFFFFFAVLVFKLRAYTLSHSISPFQDRVSGTICPGWLQTAILLISAFRVARIIGMSHWCPACLVFDGTRVWTQSFALEKEALYRLSELPAISQFLLFFNLNFGLVSKFSLVWIVLSEASPFACPNVFCKI